MLKRVATSPAASAACAAVLALVALSGCGSDADSAGDDPRRQSTATTEETATEPSPEPEYETTEPSPEPTEPTGPTTERARTPHPFCNAVTANEYAFLLDAMSDSDDARAAVEIMDGLVDEAPAALRADLRTIADAFGQKAAANDNTSDVPDSVDVERLRSAFFDVTDWEDANC